MITGPSSPPYQRAEPAHVPGLKPPQDEPHFNFLTKEPPSVLIFRPKEKKKKVGGSENNNNTLIRETFSAVVVAAVQLEDGDQTFELDDDAKNKCFMNVRSKER